MPSRFPKVSKLKTVEALQQHIESLGLTIPIDSTILKATDSSPMADPIEIGDMRVGNRWCIHPMEGWDANRDGSPTDFTLRRWRRFGESGAKLIWGGEAAAVRPDGRANPNQTMAIAENEDGLRALLNACVDAHSQSCDQTDDLVVGLQLTHSGRFCRPNGKQLEPRIAYHHPLLDRKYGLDPSDTSIVWTDQELDALIDAYVDAARLAERVGFRFVDIKACHGYLLHEFLSARNRTGRFGGDFNGRTKLLRTIIDRVANECPNLRVVVRLSVFDCPPYETSQDIGRPMDFDPAEPYLCGFGVDESDPFQVNLDEPFQLISCLQDLGVCAINVTGGSPYYNPHLQRPAAFPPSDGYLPPEDPMIGVDRHIRVTRLCKEAFPDLAIVGTGYSYLQDFLPHVAQAAVRRKWVDLVGLGRMVLSYPRLPVDSLESGVLERKLICRTFSDCTTAPRNGLISGCYPLDPTYKELDAFVELRTIKAAAKQSSDTDDS